MAASQARIINHMNVLEPLRLLRIPEFQDTPRERHQVDGYHQGVLV